MANGDARSKILKAESLVKVAVKLGEKWRYPDKPLGARNAPNPIDRLPGGALVVEPLMQQLGVGYLANPQRAWKGDRIKRAAEENNLAKRIQDTIESLANSLQAGSNPFGKTSEPEKTLNTFYLHKLADATVAAARACQMLRRGKSPSKEETQLACAWVVEIACTLVDAHKAVKQAAIDAYPLFSAGKLLNSIIDPAAAIYEAFVALDVT